MKLKNLDPAKPLFMREPLKRGKEPIVYMVTMSSMVMGSANSTVKEWVEKTGNKHWLVSYANQFGSDTKLSSAERFHKELTDSGSHIFLDSGAHTFQNLRLKPTTGKVRGYDSLAKSEDLREGYIKNFVDYCKKEGHKFSIYANFDFWP